MHLKSIIYVHSVYLRNWLQLNKQTKEFVVCEAETEFVYIIQICLILQGRVKMATNCRSPIAEARSLSLASSCQVCGG